MYVTGLGALDHALKTGFPASANPLSNAKTVPTVTIGGGECRGVVRRHVARLRWPGANQYADTQAYERQLSGVVKQGGETSNNPMMSVTQ